MSSEQDAIEASIIVGMCLTPFVGPAPYYAAVLADVLTDFERPALEQWLELVKDNVFVGNVVEAAYAQHEGEGYEWTEWYADYLL